MKKEEVKLEHLTDQDFSNFLSRCRSLNITKRDILMVTKYINKEGFSIEAFFTFHLQKNNFPRYGRQYNIEYISLRNNISHEEAHIYIEKFKKDKVTSKANFIKKHGTSIGKEKFKKFQETSRKSSSDKWFIDKYGDGWQIKKKESFQKRSKFCKIYWTDKGFSNEEAEIKVKEWQKSNAGVNREYWINQGLCSDEIDLIIRKINIQKGNGVRNRTFLKQKHGEVWKDIYQQRCKDYRINMEKLGIWIVSSLKDEWNQYRDLCTYYTKETVFDHNIKDIEYRSILFHLDHRYSIKQGFLDEIDPKIIGSIVNLQMLPAKVNCSKKEKCDITIKQLLRNYANYENSINKNKH